MREEANISDIIVVYNLKEELQLGKNRTKNKNMADFVVIYQSELIAITVWTGLVKRRNNSVVFIMSTRIQPFKHQYQHI